MNKLKLALVSALAMFTISGATLTPVFADCTSAKSCVTQGVSAAGGSSNKTDIGSLIKTIVNILLYILGAVAVIMIIIGGLKYVISNGDPSAVTSAKNTIMYAVIGLVVAILAYAIVDFVLRYIG